MSIHKSQGATFETVVVHLKKYMPTQALYVGCSRAKSSAGLYIVDDFIQAAKSSRPNDKVAREMARMEKECLLKFSLQYLHMLPSECSIRIMFHNCTSLVAHVKHIVSDPAFMCCDLLFFNETNVKNMHESVNLPHYKIVANVVHRTAKRACGGSAVYMNNESPKSYEVLLENDYIQKHGHVEICALRINCGVFVLIYKSPGVQYSEFIDLMNSVLPRLSCYSKKITCVGDFNVTAGEITKLNDYFIQYNMLLKVKLGEPSTDSGSQIDLVYSSDSALSSGYYESYYSYHKPVWMFR